MWRNLYHEPRRNISLLTTQKEAKKLAEYEEKGVYDILPTKIFFGPSGFAKVNVGVFERDELPDKRNAIDAKEYKREKKNYTID